MLKILQVRLQQYMNQEGPDVQAGFRKGRGTRDQIANIHWMIEKSREFQKSSTSSLLIMPNPLIVWITANYGTFLKIWEYQTTLFSSSEISMQVKKQQLELDMEQQTGSKLGKEYIKAVYWHSVYLSYMHSASWETLCWMKHKQEARLQESRKINNIWYADDNSIMAESDRELMSLLMKVQEDSEKAGLNFNI